MSSVMLDTASKSGTEPINKTLVTDNQLLTQELVLLTREVTKAKAEGRLQAEALKKAVKEAMELKKSLEGKENALEKLRKERDELWAVVN